MKLSDFVCFKAIIPELKAKDRDGTIAELVTALDKAGRLGKDNSQDIIKAVIKREKEASTGMGKGVALPHVKHATVKMWLLRLDKAARESIFPRWTNSLFTQ